MKCRHVLCFTLCFGQIVFKTGLWARGSDSIVLSYLVNSSFSSHPLSVLLLVSASQRWFCAAALNSLPQAVVPNLYLNSASLSLSLSSCCLTLLPPQPPSLAWLLCWVEKLPHGRLSSCLLFFLLLLSSRVDWVSSAGCRYDSLGLTCTETFEPKALR